MWIKICGWRDPAVLTQSLAAKPNAIGLNFHSASPRFVEVEMAARMVRLLPPDIEPVGVFVNHPLDDIRRIARDCGFNTVQLHGDELPRAVAELAPLRAIRVYRIANSFLEEVRADLDACRQAGGIPWACLVEPQVAGAYGGTGQTVDWESLAGWPADWPPLILAGGLNTQNVAQAIQTARPWGVDVASGVEHTRGEKAADLVERFIEQARSKPSSL